MPLPTSLLDVYIGEDHVVLRQPSESFDLMGHHAVPERIHPSNSSVLKKETCSLSVLKKETTLSHLHSSSSFFGVAYFAA